MTTEDTTICTPPRSSIATIRRFSTLRRTHSAVRDRGQSARALRRCSRSGPVRSVYGFLIRPFSAPATCCAHSSAACLASGAVSRRRRARRHHAPAVGRARPPSPRSGWEQVGDPFIWRSYRELQDRTGNGGVHPGLRQGPARQHPAPLGFDGICDGFLHPFDLPPPPHGISPGARAPFATCRSTPWLRCSGRIRDSLPQARRRELPPTKSRLAAALFSAGGASGSRRYTCKNAEYGFIEHRFRNTIPCRARTLLGAFRRLPDQREMARALDDHVLRQALGLVTSKASHPRHFQRCGQRHRILGRLRHAGGDVGRRDRRRASPISTTRPNAAPLARS